MAASPPSELIRLKCYLGATIRVVRVPPALSLDDLLLRLSAEFATPVKRQSACTHPTPTTPISALHSHTPPCMQCSSMKTRKQRG
jgi:hypothetical protein